jgi:arylformamidase
MTPEELEVAYDQSKWATNMKDIIARFSILSDATRARIGNPKRNSYGSDVDEHLDLYVTSKKPAPIFVFVHGGGWLSGSASDYAFPAEMLLAAGIHFISLDFSTVAGTNGELPVLVDQIRRAIRWVYRNCSDFGGDATRIYVAGHSSGGHLAAMALSTRWTDYDLPVNPIRGGFLVSGIYDLGPLRHTSRSKAVRIDGDIERRLSPVHNISEVVSPLFLAAGSKESPEFLRQTSDYAKALGEAGIQTKVMIGETYNHFDIVETLSNPYGLLGASLLNFVEDGCL